MKCSYLGKELAFVKFGLADDGETGTKDLHEGGMKVPKMLKESGLYVQSAMGFCDSNEVYPKVPRCCEKQGEFVQQSHFREDASSMKLAVSGMIAYLVVYIVRTWYLAHKPDLIFRIPYERYHVCRLTCSDRTGFLRCEALYIKQLIQITESAHRVRCYFLRTVDAAKSNDSVPIDRRAMSEEAYHTTMTAVSATTAVTQSINLSDQSNLMHV